MAPYLPFAAGGIGALCCFLFAWGCHLATAEQQIAGGLPVTGKAKKEDDTFILAKISELIGRPFEGLMLSLLGANGQAWVRRRILKANRSGAMTVERYARRKAGDIIFYGLLALIMLYTTPIVAVIILAYGFTVTDIQIAIQVQQRQEKIQQALPDFLDVLAVTVSAGLGFRHALARVSEAMPGPLSDEFQTTLQQMELGASRREAFEDLRNRNSSEALGQFITALLQAEELGAPLAQALNEISVDMRRGASQFARRKAQKVNPRITMVTMATIIPALLLMVGAAMFLGTDVNLGAIFGG